MKLTNEKGFTLIELIMVIVILGILAAVVVPKFFDFTGKAHTANEEAVIGNIKAALNLYAADQLVTNGQRKYPHADSIEVNGLSYILDEVPDGWEVQAHSNKKKTKIVYTDPDPDVVYIYRSPVGNDASKYELTK